MLMARSLLFVALFYLWSTIAAFVMLPLMLLPRRWMLGAFRLWTYGVFGMLRVVCNIRVELRGRQWVPKQRALIAPKHQCMLDVFAQFAWLSDYCIVMRKELMWIPFFGWYAWKTGMIVIDREGGSKTLRGMVRDGKARLADERQLLIFPEGHRGEPGVAGHYQPGVAALCRELGLPTHPVATNSGVHWPAHGFLRKPGTIVFEFFEPIPAGLPRAEFMRRLESVIEAGSNALLGL
jgi:1-acyl-sn-glycerol-3-phosphate acyltransferase